MPRITQNPMKLVKEVHQPQAVTATTVVHIPYLSGYWEHSLDVLDACLRSMRGSTTVPFDLMVFDNASCVEVRDYLLGGKKEGKIQTLILSDVNLGKVGAWNHLFAAAPGEYIAYTDSDVLFFPDWLRASLDVFSAFPKSGMVTAQPARGRQAFEELNATTLQQVRHEPGLEVEEGDLIPVEFQNGHRVGLGLTEEAYARKIAAHRDVRVTSAGVSAYVSAVHFQFVCPKPVVSPLLPLDVTRPINIDENRLDLGIDRSGGWRLSTADYLVHHMGNRLPVEEEGYDTLSPWMDLEKIRPYVSKTAGPASTPKQGWERFFMKRRIFKRLAMRVNSITHKLLSTE